MSLLNNISGPQDLKKIELNKLEELCAEIRSFFIDQLLVNGGHFSANLGVVELTVALHYVFDLPIDKLIWDVGHQSYIHKLLTGRKAEFNTIRKWKGLSGFPNLKESEYDAFGTGHSSTSISAALGMAEADRLDDNNHHHIAVIGDGSLSGGMAFEALNNLGCSTANVLVVVNDNEMGIDPNLGAVNQHLEYIEGSKENLFENLNLEYEGPVDGHDVVALVHLFERQRELSHPRVVHIKTLKGKGYSPAEEEQTKWHSVKYVKLPAIKPETLEVKPLKLQEVFGKTLLQMALKDDRIVGVTPAMPSGSSMNILMDVLPQRVFDVGIAEQHAVTFAAGLALKGKRPFCHLYSSFAQRAYDQIIHDVALQKIPVIFCLDRAGLVGEDGPTHHGMFDLASLQSIPNLSIIAPRDEWELRNAMAWAVQHLEGPVVLRYPKGRGFHVDWENEINLRDFKGAEEINSGKEICIISIGTTADEARKAIDFAQLSNKVRHIDLRFIKPLDMEMLQEVFENSEHILCIEDGIEQGGVGMTLSSLASDLDYKGSFKRFSVTNEFSPHGTVEELKEFHGLDAKSIAAYLVNLQ
ncbi:MAG: 1-deoxy-D-xylulose-5-phosphate synthase [Bacteroidia bacterium]